ncbi:MAG: DUF512 domain-containing protein, partial [Cyanobacteria bacterium P01_D01_bin.56]
LEQTLRDLARFHSGEIPAVASAAVVPVGLTHFRPTEDELVPVNTSKAREVIDQVQQLQAEFKTAFGSTFAWLADEWFLIAQQPLPPEEHYEAYPQIGNGVGSIRLFLKQFELATQNLPNKIPRPKHYTWVVGNAVEKAFEPLVDRLNQVQGLTVTMAALNSDYWGQEITVTGLLTGYDILGKLRKRNLGDGVLLPSLMLKKGLQATAEDTYFLDDMPLASLMQELQCPILPVDGIDGLLEVCVASDAS